MVFVMYLIWHYTQAPFGIVQIGLNYITSARHRFLIGRHMATLLEPWHRLSAATPGVDRTFITKIGDALMEPVLRLIGGVIRITTVLIGFCVAAAIAVCTIMVLALWLAWPVLVLGGAGIAISYISAGNLATKGIGVLIIIAVGGLSVYFMRVYVEFYARQPKRGSHGLDGLDYPASRVLDRVGNNTSTTALIKAMAQAHEALYLWLRAGISPDDLAAAVASATHDPAADAEFEKAIAQYEAPVGLGDLLAALAATDQWFSAFLLNAHLSSDDVKQLADWMRFDAAHALARKRFWDLEHLLRRPPVGASWVYGYTPLLNHAGTDITAQVQKRHFGVGLVGRADLIDQIERVLSRTGEQNVLLVGAAGVGKRTLIQGLAQRIIRGHTLPVLQYKRVVELNASTLTGNPSAAEVEAQLAKLLGEAARAGNIILYIENIETFLSASGKMGTVNATELLKQYLALPTMQVIATSDPEIFNRDIRPHGDLMQLFEKVDIAEPDAAQTLIIMERNLPTLEQGKVLTTYPALKDVVEKSDLFMHDVPFPEKALSLLAEVISDARTKGNLVITPADVARIVGQKTHAPVGQVEGTEMEKLEHLEEYIHKDLVNQETAVAQLAQTMVRLRAGITQRDKPAGSFLFTGPTGVGKTSAAKALAKAYFGSSDAMIRFDMSEYQNPDSIDRFIGSATRSEPGQFTTKVRDLPFSVILLDEIEKAHPNILNLFLQVLDEARLTDAAGKLVTFRQNIIIATSNAGSEYIRELVSQNVPVPQHKELVMERLMQQGLFKPEFLNRFDDVIVFHPLTPEQITQVARMMLEKFAERLKAQQYLFTFSDELVAYVAGIGFDPQFGARPMQRALQDTVEVIVSREIIAQKVTRGTPFTVSVDELKALQTTTG